MSKRYWRIRGHDGLKVTFEKHVPVGYFSDTQIQLLLRALTAKASLSLEEILGAYARRNSKASNDLLAISKEGPYPHYSCGTNPYFTAIVVDDHHKPLVYPSIDD